MPARREVSLSRRSPKIKGLGFLNWPQNHTKKYVFWLLVGFWVPKIKKNILEAPIGLV